MVQLDPKKKNRLYDPGGRSAAPSAPVEEPQRKKAVQGFKLPFRELGQAAEALGTAARSGARTAQALEGKAQDTNRFTVVDMAAPKEADSPAPLPAAEREHGFRLPGVEKGLTELARQTGDIARRGKETAFPQAPAERDAPLRQTRQTVQGAARGVQNAAKAAASLKLPGTGSAELLQLLADQTVQELEQELKAYRENVRIPLRAGSGYAAAELDTDSEEYRRGKALEQRLEYARIRQKKVGDLVVFTTDMAKIAAMTEEQRQDLWAVAQMKELWRGIAPNADNWSNPYVVNGQEEGHAAMQRLLEAGYSAQDVQDMAVTYQRSQNQAFMGQVRRTAQEMVDGGFLSAAGANLLTLPLQFLAGTAGTVDTAVNYVQYKLDPSAQRYSGLGPNLPWYAPSKFTDTVRQETREAIEDSGAGGKVLGYLYAGTTSAVDNLLRLYSAGGSQAVSLGLMGLSSFQDTARDVSARGGSPEQAIILGAISAGSEILTEKYSLEKLMDVLKIAGEAAPEMPRKLLRSILAQGGYEVAEEEMNLIINVFSDALVMGGNSEFNNQVAYWMESEGCTEAEAKNRAWEGLLRQAADTAIESFLSGEMMSGMGTAVEVGKQWNDARSYYRAEEAMGRVMERKNALSVPGESTQAQAADGNAGTQAEASQTGRTEGGEEAKGFLAKRAATIRAALMEEAAYQRYRRDLQTAAPLFGMKAEDFTPELSRLLFEDTEQGRYWREQLLRAEGLSAGDGGARQTLGGQEASSRQGQTVPQNGQGNAIPFRLPQQAAQTRQGQTAAQNQQGNAIPFRLPQQGIAQTRQGQTAAQNQQGNVIPFRLPQQAAQTRQGQAALQQLPVAGNNAMQLPGQTMPGNTAQGGPMLRLAQSQGSAILQTPQAFGGSAQQAPQMQGGVGVLTPPGQGGPALPGQQNQSGPAALQTQQGQAMPQGQQTGGSVGLPVLPDLVLPDDTADPYSAYQQYEQVLGGEMPAGGYAEFLRIRNAKGKEWTNLRVNYWCEVAMERLLIMQADTVAFHKPGEITAEYLESANGLDDAQKDGIYHYSCYQEGVRMNKFLGNVPGIYLTQQEMQNLENTRRALAAMCLPFNTILLRGTKKKMLLGLEKLDPNNLASWTGKPINMRGFCSTSILPGSAYNQEVQMIIMAPGNMAGAGYINEISYNKAHEGMTSGQYILQQEYEVLLQKNSEFVIMKATEVEGKLILVVKWMGGKNE